MASIISSQSDPNKKIQIDVSNEDQQNINRFAKLNCKQEELSDKIKSIKRQMDNLEEAENELILADDFDEETSPNTNFRFMIGPTFIAVNKKEMETFIEIEKNKLKKKLDELDETLMPIKDEMSKIKSILYAKFGSNINLDSEEV
ncbi:putative prefoldin subunit 4 [Sarcoptes scabiei]|uniref:Prefoldin subunit 4 n=1 Tax=Sarcoptes scabiei TaxID=52283 RepID=A0A132A748_SARSC|nr:putative prefoldin subunit 4 [Sarcoptes scabiei]KPM06709.1 prefoldin subunit 4-like protein [Sarcoptes scabiei]